MSLHVCANTTCTRMSPSTYCSRRCQCAARNGDHRQSVNDVRLGMDTYRRLIAESAQLGIPHHELVIMLIEEEVN